MKQPRDKTRQKKHPSGRRPGGPQSGVAPTSRPEVQRLLGMHCVREALLARRRPLHRLLVEAGSRRRSSGELAAVVELAVAAGLPVLEVDREELRLEGGSNSQGVGLDAGPLPELDLASIPLPPVSDDCRLIALDGVEDPQNVGALARVALGSGARAMVLTDRRAPPLSPALARASAGAIEWLPVARVTNLSRALKYLKENGFWVIGADHEGAKPLFAMPDSLLRGRLVVVMGAEGRGLRPEVRKQVDHVIRIPMLGQVESLNVASAGAVLLFDLMRRAGEEPPTS